MEKLIITAALTGGIHGKEANPALPEQPDEIIKDAIDCWNAGAAIVHLHARDPEGRGVGDPGVFREINEGISERCDVVIQNTTGGPGIPVRKTDYFAGRRAGDGIAEHGLGGVLRRREGEGARAAFYQPALRDRGVRAKRCWNGGSSRNSRCTTRRCSERWRTSSRSTLSKNRTT